MLVFTYGTLKKGLHNHRLIQDSKFIGEATTVEHYGLFPSKCGGYPYAIRSRKDTQIVGELYEVDNKTLKRLDSLEGYPIHYEKEEIEVILNNKVVKATIYFKNEDFYTGNIDMSKPLLFW